MPLSCSLLPLELFREQQTMKYRNDMPSFLLNYKELLPLDIIDRKPLNRQDYKETRKHVSR